MNLDNIYQNMSIEQKEILSEIIGDSVRSSIYLDNMTYNNVRYWMAIFAKHLSDKEKMIKLTSSRYYFKQADLDYYYPTNPEATLIAMPFNMIAPDAQYEIQFVNTTTGAKIYEYISALCKEKEEYIDRQSLAVALTEDRTHKLKIVHNKNTVWILSNHFSAKLIDQCLALFPFLFDIKELQADETVMNVCKAVSKGEPVVEYFKDMFDNITEVRERQKLDLIKQALNSRITEKAEQQEREVTNIKNRIADYEERLGSAYEELAKAQAIHMSYLSQKGYDTKQVTDILDFVKRNKYVQSLNVKQFYSYGGRYNNMLVLNIIAPITIYEPEPLDRYITAQLENHYDPQSYRGKIYRAFRRIFVEEELQMLCQTYVKLDLVNANIDAGTSSLNLSTYDYERMPQPHLTRFNCWGDNLNPIKEAIREGDICGAINDMVIAAQNINFTDSAVLNRFIELIAQESRIYELKTCLSKADGQLWSIKDVVEQLDREDNASETPETPELVDTIPEADTLDAV